MVKHLKLAICDDEIEIVNYYTILLESILEKHQIAYEIAKYDSSAKLLADVRAGMRFDIAFLDVVMPEMNGMEVARNMRLYDQMVMLVFLSADASYAMQGYKVNAANFILKPVERSVLAYTVDLLLEDLNQGSIVLPVNKSMVAVRKSSIQFIESDNRVINVVTLDEDYQVLMKADDVAKRLDEHFIRCHQSFLVNLRYCKQLKASQLVLFSGSNIPISRPYQQSVRQSFMEFHQYYRLD